MTRKIEVTLASPDRDSRLPQFLGKSSNSKFKLMDSALAPPARERRGGLSRSRANSGYLNLELLREVDHGKLQSPDLLQSAYPWLSELNADGSGKFL